MKSVKELIMPIVQLEAKRKRTRTIIIAVSSLLVINSIVGIYFIYFVPKPTFIAPPPTSTVHVSAPNVTLSPDMPHSRLLGHALPTYAPSYTRPTRSSQPAADVALHVFQTSDSRVHSYGGGGSAPAVSNGGGGKQQPAASTAVAMPVTSFVTLRSRQQLAEAGSGAAPQMAEMATAPMRRAPGPPNPGGPLPEDNQLIEHAPLPDGLLALLLMALMYAFGRIFKQKYEKLLL